MAFYRSNSNVHVRLTTCTANRLLTDGALNTTRGVVLAPSSPLNSRNMSISTFPNLRHPLAAQLVRQPTFALPAAGTWTPDHGICFASTQGMPSFSQDTLQAHSPEALFRTDTVDNSFLSKSRLTLTSNETDDSLIPPRTSLSYNIPEELFRKAKAASEFSDASYWSYGLYRGPPDSSGEPKTVNVHYCLGVTSMEKVLKQYFMDEKVIGFDLEWVAESYRADGIRKNVSLLQIASPSRVALFHISLFPQPDDQLVSPSLRKLLEDPTIMKCGVCIKADCTRLKTFLDIDVRGIMELSHLYKQVKYCASGEYHLINKSPVRLADQVQDCLKLPLFKGEVRTGDWSKNLKMDQIIYSASDAYAGIQLFHYLDEKRLALKVVPPRPHFAEEGLPIPLPEGAVVDKKKKARKTAKLFAVASSTDDTKVKPGLTATVEEEETVIESVIAEGQTDPIFTYNDSIIVENECVESEGPKVIKTEIFQSTPDSDGIPAVKRPIREDYDEVLEILDKYFDVEKLILSMKDIICFEDDKAPEAPVPAVDEADRARLLEEAEEYYEDFQQRYTDEKAPGPQHVKAFYIWQFGGLNPEQVAGVVQKRGIKSLAMNTITGYIMDVIRHGKTKYDEERMNSELIPKLSTWHRYNRYKGLIKDNKKLTRIPLQNQSMGYLLQKHLQAALSALPATEIEALPPTTPPPKIADEPVLIEIPSVGASNKKVATFKSSSFERATAYEDFEDIVDQVPGGLAPGEEIEEVDARLAEELERMKIEGHFALTEPEKQAKETKSKPEPATDTIEEKYYYLPIRPMD